MQANDGILYQRYADGDNDAFAMLLDAHYDALVLYLRTIVRSLSDAEELAEETFVRVAVGKPRFKGKSSFRTWLFSIGRHVALDYLRREKRKESLEDHAEQTADDAEIERDYILEEQKKQLHRAMRKLKPDYRQALWLVYFEELPVSEAAAAMRKTVGSTEHLIRRAKQALKEILLEEGFDYEEP